MKILISFLLVLLLFTSCLNNGEKGNQVEKELIGSYTFNLNDTLKSYQKPILLYFMADWCKGCKHVEKTYMKSDQFLTEVGENFQFYKINGDLPYEFQLADTTYILQEKMNDFMLTFFEPSMMASYPSFMIVKENKEVEAVIAPKFKKDYNEMADFLISISKR